jgi:hypothetical protein
MGIRSEDEEKVLLEGLRGVATGVTGLRGVRRPPVLLRLGAKGQTRALLARLRRVWRRGAPRKSADPGQPFDQRLDWHSSSSTSRSAKARRCWSNSR